MTNTLIHPDFLLENKTARRLYHEVAAELPIIDYHCHLPPADIAADRRFANLYDIWLEGDHYKWRALRSNGIAENLITGNAAPKEKFMAWARTLPMLWRNPLHHWTQLELARYFDIYEPLDETTAGSIWERANARLAEPDFTVRGILKKMRVNVVCTTDDPTDSLEHHQAANASGLPVKILPTFRPDRAMAIQDTKTWNEWVDALAARSGVSIRDFGDFLAALRARHDFFHKIGGRLSDHGFSCCPSAAATNAELQSIFAKARQDGTVTDHEAEQFATRILLDVARWNHEKGWILQLHLGPMRNNNTRKMRQLGRDSGFDSIGDWPQAEKLSRLLDALDATDQLPRTILYNNNPADNYVFASLIGNFQDGSIPGKVQFGAAWWFLDQKEGMEWQLNALSNLGLLRHFVGMITDSRSFLSYTRHEYFRRILCNLLGRDVEAGLVPNDKKRLSEYVTAICYENARAYFKF
ncbi:MAG: glucuronate isomerase [Methylacidiphilales bacterium]|nr:glucuronate isomerase [Candidatus Methylacidiphilales bacterium]